MADPNQVLGIILIIAGIISVFLLVLFTEFKRKERDSVKFTFIIMLIASLCLGLGIDLYLVAIGRW